MSAVFSIERPALSTFKLDNTPQQKFWFDPPAMRSTLEAGRYHQQERFAEAFRLFAWHGFDLGPVGHITARDPELTDRFWVSPPGVHLSRIKASDLLLVNARGETTIGNRSLNKTAFAIHAVVRKTHPHIVVVAHTYSIYGKAWSTLGRPLDPLTQDACLFYEDHALFDDFIGMVADSSEGERTAHAFIKPDGGTHRGVILENHGILTTGPTVEAAAWWYIALDNAAHTQLLAEVAGTPQFIGTATTYHTHNQAGGQKGALHAFESLYVGLVVAEPGVLD